MSSFDQHSTRARSAAQDRNWSLAAESWAAAIAASEDAAAYAGWVEALCELGDFDEAERVLSCAQECFSSDTMLGVVAARAAVWRRDWTEARRRWQRVQRLSPGDPAGVIGEADILRDTGQFAEADQLYEQVLQQYPAAFWARWGYARNATIGRDWQAALLRWQAIQSSFPDEPAGLFGEIDVLRETGELDAAERLLEHAAHRFPHDPWIAGHRASIALQRFDRTKALAAMDDVRSLPGSADTTLGPPIVGEILSRDPLIIHAASYSIEAVVRPVMRLYGDVRAPIYFLCNSNMSLVFHTELRERIPREIRQLSAEFPTARIIFLANDVRELRLLQDELLIRSELINNNAFVDENVFTLRPDAAKRHDAIYNARFEPYKRHELATEIKNLCVVAAQITPSQLSSLRALLPNALVNDTHLSRDEVIKLVTASRCSLCLSATEGAMYASIESLLCGIPIVTTRSIGGRDWFFSDDDVIYCEDSPSAVADGVQKMVARALGPTYVRCNALERIRRERKMYFALVDQIFSENGQPNRRFENEFSQIFHDKMNYCDRKLSDFLFRP